MKTEKQVRTWWINQWEALAGADLAWRCKENSDLAYKQHQVYVKDLGRQQIEVIEVIPKSDYLKLQAQCDALAEALKEECVCSAIKMSGPDYRYMTCIPCEKIRAYNNFKEEVGK